MGLHVPNLDRAMIAKQLAGQVAVQALGPILSIYWGLEPYLCKILAAMIEEQS